MCLVQKYFFHARSHFSTMLRQRLAWAEFSNIWLRVKTSYQHVHTEGKADISPIIICHPLNKIKCRVSSIWTKNAIKHDESRLRLIQNHSHCFKKPASKNTLRALSGAEPLSRYFAWLTPSLEWSESKKRNRDAVDTPSLCDESVLDSAGAYSSRKPT